MSNTYPDGPTLAERTGCANPGSGPTPAPRETNPNANAELAANPVMKFCRDCQWCYVPVNGGLSLAKCQAPQNASLVLDLVSGLQVEGRIAEFAENHRKFDLPDRCGPSGAWWVRREP